MGPKQPQKSRLNPPAPEMESCRVARKTHAHAESILYLPSLVSDLHQAPRSDSCGLVWETSLLIQNNNQEDLTDLYRDLTSIISMHAACCNACMSTGFLTRCEQKSPIRAPGLPTSRDIHPGMDAIGSNITEPEDMGRSEP